MKKIIATNNAPAAIGPYSQAIDCGSFLVTSGQVPFDPATGEFVPGGITEQTRQVLTNVKAILEAAGLTMDNVVKTTVFLQNMSDFAAMNAVYAEFFTEGGGGRRSAPRRTGGDRDHLRQVSTHNREEYSSGRYQVLIHRKHLKGKHRRQGHADCLPMQLGGHPCRPLVQL